MAILAAIMNGGLRPLRRPDVLRQKELKQADGPLLMIETRRKNETDRNAGNVLSGTTEGG
jgi:hypothetical protein